MKKVLLIAVMSFVAMAMNAQFTVQGIPYNNPKMKKTMSNVLPMSTTNDSFSFDDIQNWTGEGENQAAVVIQFNTGKATETNALVFGFRWNGTATGTDMLVAIAKNDPRFYCLANNGSYGYSIGGIGWDADEDGDIYLMKGEEKITLTDGKYECASEYDYDNYIAGDADDLWSGGWMSNGYWSYWNATDSPANFSYANTGASGRVLTNGCWDGWNFMPGFTSYAWLPFATAPSLTPADATTQFKVDGIYYTLDSYKNKTVKVSAPFEMEGMELTSYTGDINIPSTFIYEEVVYTVVGVADDAFASAQVGKIELPETVTSLGKRAFQNSTLSSINVTDKITKIGVAAFSGCSNLTEYKLPSSFTSIPNELYKGTAITAVTFAETIESIGASAFENCAKIETLEIPTTLKAIGASAFAGCDGLKSVKVNTIMPMAITDDVFSAVAYENATLTVPMGYTATYAAATGWKNFKNVSEFAIPVAVGDTFFVGNVAYSITECGETGNKVVVTYFPVESVSDNNIKAANKAGYVGDVMVPATVSYQNIEFTVDGVTAQAFMGAEEMTSIKFNCALTTIPERAMFSCKKLATVEIPSTVTSIEAKAFEQCQALGAITLPQGLLSIGSRAFYYCKVLENVVIPATVTSLGDYAFYECDKFTSIEFPESITAIPANVCYACDLLAEVKLGSKVESIGGSAFYNCTSLKSIELPNSLTTFGTSVFYGSGLESITIPASVTTISNQLFRNAKSLKSVTMSDDVTSIGDQVFNSCVALESIKLPSSLTSLGANAFNGCSALKSVEVPEGVTKLNNYTFQNCTSLESVKLPEGLTSMGTYVFKGCSALKSVEIPEGVTSIGNYSFQNCSALETVNLPTGLKTLGTYMFDGCSMLKSIAVPEAITTIGNYMFRNCTSLASVTMGSKVTTISQYAFNGCSALQAIELPSTVTSIAQYAFANCSSLKSISVPEGVTTINNYVFQNCSALENVTLGSKVKTLGNYAFNGCAALKVLELPETISTLGKDFVVGATNLTVYVCNATPFSWSNSFKVSSEAYAPIYVVYGAKADYEAAANWNLSAVNEIVPTIAADMENKTVLVDYNNALLQVPVTESYVETVPARFIEANNKALNAEYKTVVKFRKADTEDEYMSVDAELNEDGTFTADLLNYLEEETRYEYYWEITLGENAPVASTLDYFITEGLVTDIDEINVDNNGNAVEYYSIQGVKVDNPEKGIFIKKQGGKTTKVIVK